MIYIKNIVSNECERRDNIVWLAGLRGEDPNSDEQVYETYSEQQFFKSWKSGLQSLVLRYNDFGNYICSELSRVLSFDIYIKSIDLRNNEIDQSGVKDLINSLKSNKTILNCDIRYNKGFIPYLHRKLAINLLNNLRRAKLDPKVDEQKWMNPDLLTIEVPEYMVSEIQEKLNALVDLPLDFSPSKVNNKNISKSEIRPHSAVIKKGFGHK